MLTAARGAGAAPSTASSGASAAADLAGAGGAGAIGGGGGNFPLAVALLAFAFANFINLLSIWCAPLTSPSPPPRSKSNVRGLGRWFRRDCSRAPVGARSRWWLVATCDRIWVLVSEKLIFFRWLCLGLRVSSCVMWCASKECALL
jgi:hypothetical protein